MTTSQTALAEAPAESLDPFRVIRQNWDLLRRFIMNDALGRYRGSALGLCWSFLNPLLLLAVFTIAFGALFGGNTWYDDLPVKPIVLPIFCGMTVFGIFGETLGRSPMAILSHPNYVTKVVFPLEILPVSILGSAIVHATIGLCMLVVGQLLLGHGVHWHLVLLPVVLAPLVLLAAGLGWFLASLGVYVRDVGHSMGVITQMFFFLTPIVYPSKTQSGTVIGEILAWSPLTITVESTRRMLIWGQQPDWFAIAITGAVSAVIAWLGFVWFQKTRRGFADVL